ncbi:MAG: DUF4389 domain-containing protein [Porticoccaceae bacterium]|nr:DUF4389 domain-containing protein [Porticoccaceae bacterium]
MSDDRQSNLTNPDLWIRLVYMLVFWLLSWVARAAIAVIALIQFVLVLVNGEGNGGLRNGGRSIAVWIQQNFLFLSFASDEKPFPFQDWPQCGQGEDGSDDSQQTDIAAASSDTEKTEASPAVPPPSSVNQEGEGNQTTEENTGDSGAKSSFGNIREP